KVRLPVVHRRNKRSLERNQADGQQGSGQGYRQAGQGRRKRSRRQGNGIEENGSGRQGGQGGRQGPEGRRRRQGKGQEGALSVPIGQRTFEERSCRSFFIAPKMVRPSSLERRGIFVYQRGCPNPFNS